MLGFVDRHPIMCAVPIIVTMLVIAGAVVENNTKSKCLQISQNHIQEFRTKLSMGSKEQFDASFNEIKKLIATTGGIVQGTSWSEKEIDGFVGPTCDCINDFIMLMHETSQDGEQLYGHRIFSTFDELNNGMTRAVSLIHDKKARSNWKLRIAFGASSLLDKIQPKQANRVSEKKP